MTTVVVLEEAGDGGMDLWLGAPFGEAVMPEQGKRDIWKSRFPTAGHCPLSELVVVPQVRPERRPATRRAAEHHWEALLVVVETDAVVDGGERSRVIDVGLGFGPAFVADEQDVGVAGRWHPHSLKPLWAL